MSNTLFRCTPDEALAVRGTMLSAVRERENWERQHGALNPSKERYLARFGKHVATLDHVTLAYWHSHPVPFSDVFLSHRRTNQCFNIYAMPKCNEVGRCINGSALDPASGGDGMTLAGVLLALERGVTNQKGTEHALNDYARSLGKRDYSSGNTQASSSLRALEALGIVRQTGKLGNVNVWGVASAGLFARLCDAARGKTAYEVAAEEIAAMLAEDAANASAQEAPANDAGTPGKSTRKAA